MATLRLLLMIALFFTGLDPAIGQALPWDPIFSKSYADGCDKTVLTWFLASDENPDSEHIWIPNGTKSVQELEQHVLPLEQVEILISYPNYKYSGNAREVTPNGLAVGRSFESVGDFDKYSMTFFDDLFRNLVTYLGIPTKSDTNASYQSYYWVPDRYQVTLIRNTDEKEVMLMILSD